MRKFHAAIFLSLFFMNPIAHAKTISLMCPEPTTQAITITQQPYKESWRAYQYQAIIPADLPAQGNQLLLEGQGSESTVKSMEMATWTDFTLLCWYLGDNSDFVIYTTVDLHDDFKRCYFKTPEINECLSSDPVTCTLWCELQEEEQTKS